MHPSEVHEKAKALRKKSFTHREIAKKLNISIGSAYLWTDGITLSEEHKRKIQKRRDAKVFTKEYREQLSKIAKNRLIHPAEKYTEAMLLEKIKSFYERFGRMPLKREFNMHREYKKRFGSWNAAIRKAGFQPNPELFAHKFIAHDGHKCDSFTEKIIDDWLYNRKIPHKRHVPYKGVTRMTADFHIKPNIFLEFFGLAGEQKAYDKIIIKKRQLAQAQKMKLLELYPQDIYPVNKLKKILKV